jgi:heptosyltransferase-2
MRAWFEDAAIERILVRCPNWLGDVVMATPGLRALRAAYPGACIVGQLPEPLHPLLEGSGFLDEVWPVTPRGARLREWRAEAERVASRRFDLGIVIPESVSSALRMRWGRVRRITGFARDPVRRALLDRALPAPPEWGRRRWVSRERFVASLMAAVGAECEDLRLSLGVTAEEEARLASVLVAKGLSPASLDAQKPVVLAPGASYGEAKCWPAESYAALADQLADRGERVVLLGGPGEQARIELVRQAMESDPIVLAGVLDLGAMKALLRGARLLVANDAGARHVAAAFGVPSVVFFGPTSVAKTADNLAAVEILETEHACRPCYRRVCPIDHRCLRSIAVDEALAATGRALGRESDAHPLVAVGGAAR